MTPPPTMLDPSLLLAILASLGLLGGIGLGIKALVERRSLNATAKASSSKAGSDDANAASIVAQAARELIDPLRKELATERAENALDVERERKKVKELQAELNQAFTDVSALRVCLRDTMLEVDKMQVLLLQREQQVVALEMQVVTLEQEISRYKEARRLNEEKKGV